MVTPTRSSAAAFAVPRPHVTQRLPLFLRQPSRVEEVSEQRHAHHRKNLAGHLPAGR
jgi:hypothetical protein